MNKLEISQNEVNKNDKILKSDLINAFQSRIKYHQEYIEKDYLMIKNNIGFPEIIENSLNMIKNREERISEIKEIIKYCL